MVLYLEVPFAAIALIISLVSWKTLRTIKHLDVGKAFWIPVLISGILFFTGSIIALLVDLGIAFVYSAEITSGIGLIALCTLLGGVCMYSRQIRTNLAEKFILPPHSVSTETTEETEPSKSIVDTLEEEKKKEETNCIYNFGYLKTLPKNTPIPTECLSCKKIVDCKHSYLIKTEQEPSANLIDQLTAEE